MKEDGDSQLLSLSQFADDVGAGQQPARQQETRNAEFHGRLRQCCVNEVQAPELLPYATDVVAHVAGVVKEQERAGQLLEGAVTDVNQMYMRRLCQLDMERARYLLQWYHRVRTHKIEKFFMHTLIDERTQARMSPQEFEFAKQYCDLVGEHLQKSFLNKLPQGRIRMLTDREFDMVVAPNLDHYVAVRILKTIGSFSILETSAPITLNEGDLVLIAYRMAIPLLTRGEAELV
eukprot:TRINITY_DN5636_c0_g1_i1.p1 TRINITY_DN5636_c0_g1~~TRINITY_DN5636_c0_g1_i1.p1  ORF type:complete len:241 (+),score=53.31 TRINITY_DN5636_c0_g1_i1:27-725(+)